MKFHFNGSRKAVVKIGNKVKVIPLRVISQFYYAFVGRTSTTHIPVAVAE